MYVVSHCRVSSFFVFSVILSICPPPPQIAQFDLRYERCKRKIFKTFKKNTTERRANRLENGRCKFVSYIAILDNCEYNCKNLQISQHPSRHQTVIHADFFFRRYNYYYKFDEFNARERRYNLLF